MTRRVLGAVLFACTLTAVGQNSRPTFAAADLHPSPGGTTPGWRDGTQGDVRMLIGVSIATMITNAYGVDMDRIVGGPNWLDLDPFDVNVRIPADANRDTQRLMLQSLLAERFKLVVHSDTRPVPGFALTAGKKPQLKSADGKGESGCHVDESPAVRVPAIGNIGLSPDQAAFMGVRTLHVGAGMIVPFVCRNVTLSEFAQKLPKMMAVGLNSSAVTDETALPGKWDFQVRWSISSSFPGRQADISIFDAVDKQLGLKLIEKSVAVPVIVVDSVNRKPTENPAGTAQAFPPAVPAEFDAVSIKPADPSNPRSFGTPARGQFVFRGGPIQDLVKRAFPDLAAEQIQGVPEWAVNERFDVFARYTSATPALPGMEALAPAIRALLAARCKMTYHIDERPLSAYSLVAVKPRLKKADPASRISCKSTNAGEVRTVTCQNYSMTLLAGRLRSMGMQSINLPVADGTGLQGGWDFSLSFNAWAGSGAIVRGEDNPQPSGGMAAEPSGTLTLFDALEKQLGLKLEKRKRPMPVLVINHLERPVVN